MSILGREREFATLDATMAIDVTPHSFMPFMSFHSTLFILLLAVPQVLLAGNVKEALCAYMVKSESGFKVAPALNLRVADPKADAKTYTLPEDAPENVAGITCIRNSVIPLASDVRVARAGHVLYISTSGASGGGMLRLEIKDGVAIYQMVSGELTKREKNKVDRVLLEMNSPAPVEKTAD
jgi:hypothetical protein